MVSNLLILTTLGFVATIAAFPRQNIPTVDHKSSQTHVLLNGNYQQKGSTIRQVNFEAEEWIGYVSCDFTGQGAECDLSLHEEGQRIDINQHEPNMEVLQSCFGDQHSIGLKIHNFSYSDVQDYTCLSINGESWTTDSGWLWSYPDMDAYVPDSARAGDRIAFTCRSYAGTPLYWVLPGAASNRGNILIASTDNGINSTSILTFDLLESDNYGTFWCCAEMTSGQETLTPCTLYNVAFNKVVDVAHFEFYPANSPNWEIICQFQGYPDPGNVVWEQCESSNDRCKSFESSEEANVLSHLVTSNVTIPPTEDYYYSCSATNNFGTTKQMFYPITDNFSPLTSINYKTFYYSTDGFAFRISCTVTANPFPDMFWTMQNFWAQSNGSITIYPDQTGKYQVINSITGLNTYDSTLIIQPYDFELDHATFACFAVNSYGTGATETQAELGPTDVSLYVCGGNYHILREIVETVFIYSGFPPPKYDITVTADNNIDYQLNEHYENATGINVVTVSLQLSNDNPHVQIKASAFFPYVLFTNEQTVDIYLTANAPTTPAHLPYCN
ncbi:hypothetical protein CHUAL_004372 [Chamberlinius hualienensis]